MSHVFVSYAPQDEAFAKQVVHDLKSHDVNALIDLEFESQLETIQSIVVVMSLNGMASEQVKSDVALARDYEINVVPILYRYTHVINDLRNIPWADLSSQKLYQANFPKLVQLLKNRPSNDMFLGNSKISGIDAEQIEGQVAVVSDPRTISPWLLGQYVNVLAIISAPLVDENGKDAFIELFDVVNEWHKLVNAIATASQGEGVPFAVNRILPPTRENLAETVHNGNYQILHMIGSAQGDVIYLENEWGYAAPLYPQSFLSLLQNSTFEVLIAQFDLSIEVIELLLDESDIKAIITAPTYISEDVTNLFTRYFYSQLAAGKSVRTAFNAAMTALEKCCAAEANEYALYVDLSVNDVEISKPLSKYSGSRLLINSGLPPMQNVPAQVGYVGHRVPLVETTEEIASSDFRQIAVYGQEGVGKSWMVAEYVVRSGWRYPDGILWTRVTKHTKSEDIVGQLLALLELDKDTNWATLRDILRERVVLIVLDQTDEWDDPVEIGELTDFIARLDNVGGTRVLLTATGSVQPLTYTSGTEENLVGALAPDETRRLIQRLLLDHRLEHEFSDPKAMDAFLDKTQNTPWLIHEGLRLVQTSGTKTALEILTEATEDVADVYEHYLMRRFDELSEEARSLLSHVQGFPDGFDNGVIEVLTDGNARKLLRELVHNHMLKRETNHYFIPPIVRFLLKNYAPINDETQDQIDTQIINHMLRTGAS